ncbi:Aerobic-type carbon monoxide dehydrogenase large subunit CoxL/CutL-like protein [Rubrobacter radiotolerans]|uniref:Aerobic-type carbon monoxide dehydrogenase large subunit CoxL/CutL-like protein n=1 Tax=Rubrobacter radiotolerans TaxID=42256 RepID=A0A023X1X4_RUBRA|nr:molybdopterin cofactor-binding domain-containing protein [Rubrobacter radiotolerans]AHY46206.1 Aerobic-type carbon monoxide dehydrogenase large subunit CoxL/CutL-like protein [Rubrobacter radiotolerans]MDX5893615.1 molybdopterin cofactor-binding domain-containing protein [Rubrobacter radiotolerans]SMC04126.1 carbon-monoxide dehydrogenase large subunit [Rubrobacter radiotolerans DSM 5868]
MTGTVRDGGKYVGTSVPRREDAALLTGRGTWTDDIKLPGMLHFALLRSPHAHAKVRSVDVSGALGMPGVVAAFTGKDLAGEFAIGIPTGWPVTEDIKIPDHPPLATSEVNHVGDGVAVVVAEDRYAAKDALEAIEVDYEELPAVVDVEEALADGAPLVHEEFGTNHCYTWPLAVGDVEEAFREADVVVEGRYVQQRLIGSAVEPRAVVVAPDPVNAGFTVYTSTQVPHFVRDILAVMCGVPDAKLRVVAPDVGGGFGSKLNVYAEEALALALARRLGVPVKWVEERSENHVATTHGRGQVQRISVAATSEGKILGMKVDLLADMGAYLQLLTPGIAVFGAFTYCGLYDFGAYSFECKGVFTNLTPTDAYRGAGRSEAAYAHERIMDDLARALDMDPAEVRLKNLIEPFSEPRVVASGVMYDSGDYERTMRRALELVDYEGIREEQKQRREAGDPLQLGVGIGNFTESGGLSPSKVAAGVRLQSGGWEAATVRMLPSGKAEVVTGTSPHGQGHETAWAQIVADDLGIPPEDVEVLHSDTAIAPFGRDTYGSRSLPVGGVAVHLAAGKVVEKAKRIAAHMLEAAEGDIEFESGRFSVAGSPDQGVTIQEVAGEAFLGVNLPEGMEPNLTADHHFDPPNFTWPFGTHICVVEVDTETGKVSIPKFVAVDDCGPVVNPQIVDGQLHGGIAQGIGQALYEEAVYDADGNPLTATWIDYMVPGAPEIPNFTLEQTVTPSPTNPMGVKGIGESGAIGSSPAVVNAVIDALSHLGVTHIDMPATPLKVWEAIRDAGARTPGITE